jgi:hypothetical protein
MKPLSIIKYAALKGVSRNAVYLASKRGEIIIDHESGVPLIMLNKKNKDWMPSEQHRASGLRKKT